jgi:hypothetical protein
MKTLPFLKNKDSDGEGMEAISARPSSVAAGLERGMDNSTQITQNVVHFQSKFHLQSKLTF